MYCNCSIVFLAERDGENRSNNRDFKILTVKSLIEFYVNPFLPGINQNINVKTLVMQIIRIGRLIRIFKNTQVFMNGAWEGREKLLFLFSCK